MIHKFACDGCEITVDDSNTKIVHKCPKCGQDMRWDLHGIGVADGDYNHVSESMAVSPDQIAEHRAHFPDVDVLPDGRIHFTSVKQQSKYIDKCGFHKHTKRIKPKGEHLKVS